MARPVGQKMEISTCVDRKTFNAIEEARGSLKRSTFCALVLEELFIPQEEGCNVPTENNIQQC